MKQSPDQREWLISSAVEVAAKRLSKSALSAGQLSDVRMVAAETVDLNKAMISAAYATGDEIYLPHTIGKSVVRAIRAWAKSGK